MRWIAAGQCVKNLAVCCVNFRRCSEPVVSLVLLSTRFTGNVYGVVSFLSTGFCCLSDAQRLVDAKAPEALVKVAGFLKEHQCDGGFEMLQRSLGVSPP